MYTIESEIKLKINEIPSADRVKEWIAANGFELVKESEKEKSMCFDHYLKNTANEVVRIRNYLGSYKSEVTVKKLIPNQPFSRYEVEFEAPKDDAFELFHALGFQDRLVLTKGTVVVYKIERDRTLFHVGFYTVSATHLPSGVKSDELVFAEVEIDKDHMGHFSYDQSDAILNRIKSEMLHLVPEAEIEPRSLYTIFSGKDYKFVSE